VERERIAAVREARRKELGFGIGTGSGVAAAVFAIFGLLLLAQVCGSYFFLSDPARDLWNHPETPLSILCALTALILGHTSLHRSKDSRAVIRGRMPATAGLFLGYAWFGITVVISSSRLEVIALLGLVEAPRVFLGQYRQKPWRAFLAGCFLAGCTWVLLVSGREVLFGFGVAGVLMTVLLPGVFLFPAQSRAYRASRILIAGTLYLLAVLGVFGMLEGHEKLQRQNRRWLGSRTVPFLRNLGFNLETYYMDHGEYPPAVDANGAMVPIDPSGSSVSSGYVPWMLTTPISYRQEIPVDGFSFGQSGGAFGYRYATDGVSCWILAGNGPDGDVDVQVRDYPDPAKGNCEWERFASHFGIGDAIEYDGTNGVMSNGDIMRVGPR
jgi:hypothetical protein